MEFSNNEKKHQEVDSKKDLDLNEIQYRKIFVGGLPLNLDFITFREYFLKFGDMEDCVILKDKHTKKPRGFGFVTYYNYKSAAKVMELRKDHVI